MSEKTEYPLVSICTPTFNRRHFIPYIIKCYLNQDYPRDKLEWIVIDDGTDKVEELFKDVPNVKYFYYEKKMNLGTKRNLMHSKTSGEFLVYMDDDDFYPVDRVSHAVKMLQEHPYAICAGSSKVYAYSCTTKKMHCYGPHGPNHATAGTFAFKRKMLDITSYDENAAYAEERSFLKNYTMPFVQLDPTKTILVFFHNQNTYDKKEFLHKNFSDKTLEDFIKDEEIREFYTTSIKDISYNLGDRENKPDVIKQMKTSALQRAKANPELMNLFRKQQEVMQKQQSILQKQQNIINVLMARLKDKK